MVHFITTIENGGAENHLRDLVSHQCADFDVTIVYFKGRPYYSNYYNSLNVNVIKSSWWSAWRNARIIRARDIVHAHLIYAEIAIFLTRIVKNVKYFVSKHNDAHYPYIPKWIARFIFPLLNKRYSKVICITHNVRRYCLEYQRLEKSNLEVIYYGLNANSFSQVPRGDVIALRNKLSNNSDVLLIGVVARLHRQKRLDILLRALHDYKDNDWILLIAGEGEEKNFLWTLARDLNLDHKVQFLGKIDYVPLFMNSIDLFVLPSEHEGLGLVLLEALSTGVHIIGSDAGAIPEVLGEHGRIFKSNNVGSLSALLADYMGQMNAVGTSEIELRRSRLKEVFDVKKNYDSINFLYNAKGKG